MKVKFMPIDKEFEIKPDQSVLDLAHENDIHIQSVCKGVPSCAECRIQILEGEYNVIPPSNKELNLIGTAQFVDRSRLSCQLRCFGNITVDLSQQIEKEAQASKRPRGKFSKATGESSAVKGNIMLQEKTIQRDMELMEAEKALIEDETRRAIERIKRKKKGLDQEDDEEN